MIPLGGLAFRAVGRNPMLGCIVAYAATSGGYSAAPMVNAMDTVLGGLSTSAAQIIDPEYVVSPVANFYFNFISMFVVAGAITLVTELLLSKRADAMELDPLDEDDPEAFDVKMALDAKEKRGVLFAVITIVVCAAILFF
ncbi:p-aminobenzoyl-glutamate transporter, partial [Geobacillus sp. MMMUD3]|nr:p-aminobenzoyl-glutamate transporter [Geobacillus sp. MMMUD3]